MLGLREFIRCVTMNESSYLDIEDAQNRRNTAALEAANIGVFEFEPQSERAFWDDRVRAIWGAEPHEEIDYAYVVSKVDPRDRELHDSATAQALDPDGPGVIDMEYRLIPRGNQPETWLRARAKTKFQDGKPIMLVGTVEDITLRKRAELRNELLLRELQHRLKNTMAVVSTIVDQTSLKTDNVTAFADSIHHRLNALSTAQELLQKNAWSDVELAQIASETAAAFLLDADKFQTDWHGSCLIPEQYVMSMSLGLFELVSNSLKYGALQRAGGVVQLSSSAQEGSATLIWQETVNTPIPDGDLPQTGFGSVLLRRVLPSELNGTATHSAKDGVVTYTLSFEPMVPHGT